MARRYAELILAWRDADRAASVAEETLREMFEAYVARQGPAPTEAQRAAVAALREQARERLRAALSYLDSR